MSEDQEMAIAILKSKKIVKKGDQVIVVGERVYKNHHQPQMRIVRIEE